VYVVDTDTGGEQFADARSRFADIRDRLDDAIVLTGRLTTLDPELDALRGVGSACDGEAVATVDRYGVLIDVRIQPAALAAGAAELRSAVLTAVGAALLDMRGQIAEATGAIMAPVRGVSSVDETVAMLEQMFDEI
jgi:23S rRNA G2069 N7-methylase RlmK/C1962 C5-methylase RlmI